MKGEEIRDKSAEEYDISTEIWNKYKTKHPWNINSDDKDRSTLYWGIENPEERESNRKSAYITEEGKKRYGFDKKCLSVGRNSTNLDYIRLSGDIIFNFSARSPDGRQDKQYDKYSKLLESLSDEDKRKVYQNKLNDCKEKHHSPENCSLLLSTGNLQKTKKYIGDDRGDTFLWLLDSYFKGENEIILNHATPELVGILKTFLDSFKVENSLGDSIYNYCLEFYNVKNNDNVIDKLVRSGSKAINTPERVCQYVDLALDFWKARNPSSE